MKIIKTMTQEIFKLAPDWAESAVVDADGGCCGCYGCYVFNAYACQLIINNDRDFAINAYLEDLPNYPEYLDLCVYIGDGYDTTDWQNSAIDRLIF